MITALHPLMIIALAAILVLGRHLLALL
jgi:hypothetical protein